MKRPNVAAALAGLTVAWGGTVLLLSPAYRLLGPPGRPLTMVLGQLGLWVLFGAVIAIVVLWEKQPPASIGVRPFGWSSVTWGLALAAAMIFVVIPLLTRALRVSGIPGFEAGMAKALMPPVWIRIIAVVTAGIVEDTMFLGYAVTRLAWLTGRWWLGATIALAVSSLLHLPHWGIGPVIAFFVGGVVPVRFFLWRRDLMANIIAHVTVDAVGLVIVPVLSSAR